MKKKIKEVWKEIPLGRKSKFRYAVSNFGRLKSFEDDLKKGRFLHSGTVKGSVKPLPVYKLVAVFFLKNKPDGKNQVLHKDYNSANNHVDNLMWASKEEMSAHNAKNPAIIEALRKRNELNRLKGKKKYIPRIRITPPIKFYSGEEWKEIKLEDKLKFRYAVSNYGRIMSFIESFKDGRLLKPSIVSGHGVFVYHAKDGKKPAHRHAFIKKLVAQYFLPPPKEGQTYVLILDRNRSNNHVSNLKWATEKELHAHTQKSPFVIKARMVKRHTTYGKKLNATQVLLIKQRLFDPNRKTRLKIIAKQYGVSEMALHRIKTGENWGHIKVRGQGKEKQ